MSMIYKSKKILNELILAGLSGIGTAPFLKGVPVLHYHSVNGENQASATKSAFLGQIRYFNEHEFSLISLGELVEHLKDRKSLPPKSLVLTFDDGFKTNYDIAFPILRDFGYSATIFVTTGRVGKTVDWEKRKDFFGLPLMSWREIKEMARYGIDFGAHSVTHPHFTQISPQQARSELGRSQKMIEDALGRSIRFFAYPYGDYNSEVEKVVKEFNFTGACTTEPGLNRPGQDLFALKRSGVFRNTSMAGFKTRLNGSFSLYFYAKKLLKGNRALERVDNKLSDIQTYSG